MGPMPVAKAPPEQPPATFRSFYDCASLECAWTKAYLGRHTVHYRGFREGKGIWGVWELEPGQRGGFSIWPRRQRR